MATNAQVCPVVGTTNTILPPSHPDFDASKPGLVCPVTNASTDHHHQLHKHPGLPSDISDKDAKSCPALKDQINNEENKALDEGICPVVGPVSTVLPPDHPTPKDGAEVCPVTKATLKHHKDKVVSHPSVEGAAEGAVCPVVGKKA
ncbi:hypothetical protein DL98DRAFT_518642 [Cadophora sp. DSE1049]|nr:hypothetical protein DL98DRAFT_518642 [Cadophora sp. DSE1049]